MIRMNINILGSNETRWTSNGVLVIGNYKMIFTGGSHHVIGVGLLLDPDMAKCVFGQWAVSDRVPLVKIQGNLTS